MTIGDVSKQTGIGIETIRFYERKGLIPEPPRTDGGYRIYPEDTVARLRFIRRAKELGFTLSEIADLLFIRGDSGADCGEVREQAIAKITDVARRISDLKRIKKQLETIASECEAGRPLDECPILEALEGRNRGNAE